MQIVTIDMSTVQVFFTPSWELELILRISFMLQYESGSVYT